VRKEKRVGEKKFKILAHSVLGLLAAIRLDNMGRKLRKLFCDNIGQKAKLVGCRIAILFTALQGVDSCTKDGLS